MQSTVVGVRFQEAGKIYYFEPGGYDEIDVGSFVVVETSRGVELGRVVIAPAQVLSAELTEPLKSIMRPAIPEDIDRADDLRARAREVTALARERAAALGLPMKVSSAQYTLDGARVTIFFTSEDRVDFRDLIRDLGHQIHAQVQLRQVGPRDQAKLIGGYGLCGRRLCCTSWLTTFPSISIRMAKEQNLPLNPAKISGQCGRLLCCLSYENDIYKQLKHELPKPDSWLSTPSGDARVVAVNAIKQIITLQMQDFRVVEFTVAQLAIEVGVTRPLPDGPIRSIAETRETAPAVDSARGLSFAEPSVQAMPVRPPGPPRRNAGQQPLPGAAAEGDQQSGRRRNRGQNRLAADSGGSPVHVQAPQTDLNNQPPPAPAAGGAEGEGGGGRKRRRRRHGNKSQQ
ncbi:MAG: PSP1 domain-containing protein [Dehalococcoidia bacterium]